MRFFILAATRIPLGSGLSALAPARRFTDISMVYCTSFESKIGLIYVASTDTGVCKICLPRQTKRDFLRWLREHFDDSEVTDNKSRNREVIDQLTRYFNGKLARFTVSIDMIGTPFQIRVWKELTRISYGNTITYKHLAKRLGTSRGFQAIGRANAANPIPIIVPCHRVLGTNGSLVGYSSGVKTKEFLLKLEGALMI
jgi:methylated-DNA-[protein]-cysteine S-methyltransferase